MGHHVILTFFDRGGSLLTTPIDINQNPEEFLRILVGFSCAPLCLISFDATVILDVDGKKRVLVAWTGDLVGSEVVMDTILFISDALHGRRTTVWTALMSSPEKPPRWIVVKDSWIDPLQKFTKGGILARLNKAGVKGMPKLIHEQQVQGPHPSRPNSKVNQSTHFLRTLLSHKAKSEVQNLPATRRDFITCALLLEAMPQKRTLPDEVSDVVDHSKRQRAEVTPGKCSIC